MSNHINTLGEVFAFLKELQHNNNREWFAAHKQQYDYLRDTWLNDLQSLIAQMSDYDPSLRGVQAKDCAYRIYRDIRFSADKTPYKTYFSAVIGAKGRKTSQAAYYLPTAWQSRIVLRHVVPYSRIATIGALAYRCRASRAEPTAQRPRFCIAIPVRTISNTEANACGIRRKPPHGRHD